MEMLKLLASRRCGGVGEWVVITGWVVELTDFTRDSSGANTLDVMETGRPAQWRNGEKSGHNPGEEKLCTRRGKWPQPREREIVHPYRGIGPNPGEELLCTRRGYSAILLGRKKLISVVL